MATQAAVRAGVWTRASRRFAAANRLTSVDLLVDLQHGLVRSVGGPEAASDPASFARVLRNLREREPERLAEFWSRY